MGAGFWGQVGLPLLIGLAIQIVATALCFLSVRLWNCFMKQIKPQTAVGESAHDQPLPDGIAAAQANAMPDLEMGNGYGSAQGGESMAESELEMGSANGGDAPKAPSHESRSKRSPCACQMDVPVETKVDHGLARMSVVWPMFHMLLCLVTSG